MTVAIRKDWIERAVPGRTFAEVGGLWGTVNEQVTVAAKAGARAVTMIDVAPDGGPEGYLWDRFRERCRQEGVSDYACVRADVNASLTRTYSDWGASQLHKDGKHAGWIAIGLRPPIRFFKMYVLRLGFLDGIHGLVLCSLGAFTVFLKYGFRMLELVTRSTGRPRISSSPSFRPKNVPK